MTFLTFETTLKYVIYRMSHEKQEECLSYFSLYQKTIEKKLNYLKAYIYVMVRYMAPYISNFIAL